MWPLFVLISGLLLTAVASEDSWCVQKDPLRFNGVCRSAVGGDLLVPPAGVEFVLFVGDPDGYAAVVGPSVHVAFGRCGLRLNLNAGVDRQIFVNFLLNEELVSVPTRSLVRFAVRPDRLLVFGGSGDVHTFQCDPEFRPDGQRSRVFFRLLIEKGISGVIVEVKDAEIAPLPADSKQLAPQSAYSFDRHTPAPRPAESKTTDGPTEHPINRLFRAASWIVGMITVLIFLAALLLQTIVVCMQFGLCKYIDET